MNNSFPKNRFRTHLMPLYKVQAAIKKQKFKRTNCEDINH